MITKVLTILLLGQFALAGEFNKISLSVEEEVFTKLNTGVQESEQISYSDIAVMELTMSETLGCDYDVSVEVSIAPSVKLQCQVCVVKVDDKVTSDYISTLNYCE